MPRKMTWQGYGVRLCLRLMLNILNKTKGPISIYTFLLGSFLKSSSQKGNYNPNMYYPPPLSNLFQVEQNPKQNNMIFHQSFSIARIILQLPSIIFYFISMSHTHFFLREGSPKKLQAKWIFTKSFFRPSNPLLHKIEQGSYHAHENRSLS
jgi:hypothetical protein